MSIKVAIVGAGSLTFSRRLIYDILGVKEFAGITISLHDINEKNLDMIYQVIYRDIKSAGLPTVITKSIDRREALKDANYIVCCVRVGGLEAFSTDIEIPLKYGVDQCVGDTLCAGGIMYAQRTISAMLDFCKDIREVAKPGALLLNYSNPNAMNTWACNKYGKVNTVGLCHGVHGGVEKIAKALKSSIEDIDYICAGINHQTWYISIKNKGIPVSHEELLKGFEDDPELSREEKIRIDMLKRFGYFTTESNGHVSEYLPWYRKRPSEIRDWISLDCWIHGETGGYLRLCTESRNWFEYDFPRMMAEPSPEIGPENRSHEHGSYIMESLETGRVYRGHFNVPNQGYITNLPNGCIVEVPGYVDRNGINIPVVGDLPLACAATCSVSIRVQEMAVEAAVHGDPLLLKQAMLHDPLTGAVLNPPEVWQLCDEMLVAQEQWLPRYSHYMKTAKRNLKENYRTPKGPPVDPSTRLRVHSNEEIKKSREKAKEKAGKTSTLPYDPDREVASRDKH